MGTTNEPQRTTTTSRPWPTTTIEPERNTTTPIPWTTTTSEPEKNTTTIEPDKTTTTTPEPWTTTTMGPTTTTYPINVQCKPSEDGKPVFIPHPFECAKYFECQFQGGAISMSCPDGLVFDPDLEICNWPWLVDCTNTP